MRLATVFILCTGAALLPFAPDASASDVISFGQNQTEIVTIG
jgi:hypothetical protein